MDIEKLLRSDDVDALGKLLDNHGQRRRWKSVLRGIDGSHASGDIFLRGLAEAALASLVEKQAVVPSTIQVLRAEERLVEINRDGRWMAFLEAREEGASWDDIAAATDHTTGDSARAWYASRITRQVPPLSEPEMARARAVFGDVPADQADQAERAAEGESGAVVDDPPTAGES